MLYNVIKSEDNVNFIENKHHSIFTDEGDGIKSISHNLYAISDRIWLEEEFCFNIAAENIYRIKMPNKITIEGNIIGKGTDQYGYYIIFLNERGFEYAHVKEKQEPINPGEVEIEVILSRDMIAGAEEVLDYFNGRWPCFHAADFKIIEKSLKNMILEFYGGYLDDKLLQLTICNIISETYDENCIESFKDNQITSIQFRKVGDNMAIMLFDDYFEHKMPNEINTSLIQEPTFDINSIKDEYIIEEHKNHGVIICENIKMSVSIDEVKKLELEEGFKKFLDECKQEFM